MSVARVPLPSTVPGEEGVASKAPADPVDADHWVRIGGVGGLAFVALAVGGFVVQGDVPVYADGPAQIKQWFADNADRYLAGYYLLALAIVAFLPFLAGLTTLLMRAHGGPHPSSLLALIAGVLVPVYATASTSFDGTLALLEGDVSDDVARVLSAADYYAYSVMPLMLGIFSLATSLALSRSRLLWHPLAWVGVLIGVAGIIAGAVPVERNPDGVLYVVGIATLFAFFVWVLALSVAMLRQRDGG